MKVIELPKSEEEFEDFLINLSLSDFDFEERKDIYEFACMTLEREPKKEEYEVLGIVVE